MRDRSTVLNLWRALGAVILLGLSALPAVAAAAWTVAQVRGTAFSLVGNKWEEMARGQEMPDEQVIRTLPSGRVQLDGSEGRLDMAGGTAIQLGTNRITQFSGSLTVQTAVGGSLTIATDKIVADVRGTATLRFDGSDVSIEVAGGTVRVAGASQGQTVNLVAGQSLDTSDTPAATASATGGTARSTNAAGGNPNANEAAGSNANAGSGNNAGNSNSNAGGNGNGNENSGGGESNAGGNGNGNSGDNGNSGNSGNSGDNGNSGNNGNGNNGNGNGNGGG